MQPNAIHPQNEKDLRRIYGLGASDALPERLVEEMRYYRRHWEVRGSGAIPFEMLPIIGRLAGIERPDTPQSAPIAAVESEDDFEDIIVAMAEEQGYSRIGPELPWAKLPEGTGLWAIGSKGQPMECTFLSYDPARNLVRVYAEGSDRTHVDCAPPTFQWIKWDEMVEAAVNGPPEAEQDTIAVDWSKVDKGTPVLIGLNGKSKPGTFTGTYGDKLNVKIGNRGRRFPVEQVRLAE